MSCDDHLSDNPASVVAGSAHELIQGREHPYPAYCQGERCRMCGQPARHKVGEESAPDWFHNLTAYLCCSCFWVVFGDAHDSYPYGQPNPIGDILGQP